MWWQLFHEFLLFHYDQVKIPGSLSKLQAYHFVILRTQNHISSLATTFNSIFCGQKCGLLFEYQYKIQNDVLLRFLFFRYK